MGEWEEDISIYTYAIRTLVYVDDGVKSVCGEVLGDLVFVQGVVSIHIAGEYKQTDSEIVCYNRIIVFVVYNRS